MKKAQKLLSRKQYKQIEIIDNKFVIDISDINANHSHYYQCRDIHGELAYLLVELVILAHLAVTMLNTWAFLPCNL